MRYATTILTILLLFAGGCGSTVALVDAQAALAKVDEANLRNWQKARAMHVGKADKMAADLETNAAAEIARATDGTAALSVFVRYQATRAKVVAAKAKIEAEYSQCLDNAFLAVELRQAQTAIIMGWYGLFKMIPGVESARMVAEQKARKWTDTLNKETTP